MARKLAVVTTNLDTWPPPPQDMGVRHLSPRDLVERLALHILLAQPPPAAAAGQQQQQPHATRPSPRVLVACLALTVLSGAVQPTNSVQATLSQRQPNEAVQATGEAGGVHGAGVAASGRLQASSGVLERLRQRCVVITSAGPRVLSGGLLAADGDTPAGVTSRPHGDEHCLRREPAPAVPIGSAAVEAQRCEALPAGGSRELFLPAPLLPPEWGCGEEVADVRQLAAAAGNKDAGGLGSSEWVTVDEAYVRKFPGKGGTHWRDGDLADGISGGSEHIQI